MKSAEEWADYWNTDINHPLSMNMTDFVKQIQSDAFHAGKLEGLAEAREIFKESLIGTDDDSILSAIVEHHESVKKQEAKPKETLRYRPED